MKKNFWFGAILFAALTAISTYAFGDDAKFRAYNCWEQGVYQLNQDCLSTSLKTIDNKVVERQQVRSMLSWRIEVEDVEKGQKMNMKLTRLVIREEVNNSPLVFFDSSSPKEKGLETLYDSFAKIKDQTVAVYVLNGTPYKTDGYGENFWETLPAPNNDFEESLISEIKSIFSDLNLRQAFETLSYLDSAEEVSVGDKWRNETVWSLPSIGDKTLLWDCSLDSVQKSGANVVANVSGSGALDVDINERSKMQVKLDGSVKYNAKACYPIEALVRATISTESVDKDDSNAPREKLIVLQKNNFTIAKH